MTVTALELVAFSGDESRSSHHFAIAHVYVREPESAQLFAISQNLRRPKVDPYGKAEGTIAPPMRLITAALCRELTEPLGIEPIRVGSSGRVHLNEAQRERNPVNDRAPVTVSVAAVARRIPRFPETSDYKSGAWTPVELWSFALAYGLAPGMQWPADTWEALEAVRVDAPNTWTAMVTEIGQAFVCVDPAPDEVRFRGFWSLAQTRFVDLLILSNRQVLMLESLSEKVVELGRSSFDRVRSIDNLALDDVTGLRRDAEQFGREYAAFRNENWFTIVPRRNRATTILQKLHERLYSRALLQAIDAEVSRISTIIAVATDRRAEAFAQEARARDQQRNALLAQQQAEQDHLRSQRDWLISVISAIVGLPSIVYALAAIAVHPSIRAAIVATAVWVALLIPTTLFVHRLLIRHRRRPDSPHPPVGDETLVIGAH